MKMTQEQFEDKCYGAYQLDWMISHGYTLDDYRKNLSDLAGEAIEDDTDDIPTNADEMTSLIENADTSFQEEMGFCGSLFACKDEFLDAEYLDPDYMDGLLSVMNDSKQYKTMWERFTGLKLKVTNTLIPGPTYNMPIKNGHLDIFVSQDPSYPGIDIQYISDKEDKLPDNELHTRPRVLIENNESVLRAVVWADPSQEDYTDTIDFTCAEDISTSKKE